MQSELATNDAIATATASIVSAYLGANTVAVQDVPSFIQSVASVMSNVANGSPAETEPEPAKASKSQINKSIKPDYLTSFVDGKQYKTLKRHLTSNGMTVEQYRTTFGLPADYPSVAPNYSAARSAMAKSLGLGAKGRGRGRGATAPAAKRGRKATAA